ncbi:MAG: 1-(5-phosphoribosyl)-5-[(5-phosphoribosylamino)methylideneamino] imidazole-4-carboxamide isomerase [bacterium]
MILIFPSIEIKEGQSVQFVQGESGCERIYSVDPIQLAVLWRGENAKVLYVIDLDGVVSGTLKNRHLIELMVKTVDIPIQVSGGLHDYHTIASLFEADVYRVVLGSAAFHTPELVQKIIRDFGARKIAVAIEARAGKLRTDGGTVEHDQSPIRFAKQMKDMGVCRFIYSEYSEDGQKKILNLHSLQEFAVQTNVRVTTQGGVNSYQDLISLQALERFGVDSVIIGKALYENNFPCQRLWRINENDLQDLSPTRRW